MSKKERLEKQKQRQLERKRAEELEEQREREEARHTESRAAKKMRRSAKRGYGSWVSVLLCILMLAGFLYSGFFYGGIMIVGQFTGAAENMPSHTALLFLISDILMVIGIVLAFAKRYIIQGIFTISGSALYLIAGQRVISDIQQRLEKYYVDPELREMDKTYMRYYYPVAIVTICGAAVFIIALVSFIKKKRRLKRERDNAPVESIVG